MTTAQAKKTVEELTEKQRAVYQAWLHEPTPRLVAESTGLSPQAVHNTLTMLRKFGLVTKVATGPKGGRRKKTRVVAGEYSGARAPVEAGEEPSDPMLAQMRAKLHEAEERCAHLRIAIAEWEAVARVVKR